MSLKYTDLRNLALKIVFVGCWSNIMFLKFYSHFEILLMNKNRSKIFSVFLNLLKFRL